MESKLYNHEMVWKLSNAHEKELAAQAAAEAALAQKAAGANPGKTFVAWCGSCMSNTHENGQN